VSRRPSPSDSDLAGSACGCQAEEPRQASTPRLLQDAKRLCSRTVERYDLECVFKNVPCWPRVDDAVDVSRSGDVLSGHEH
jgi:hypothetical protein